jgi:hypothetical protein
MHDYSVCTTIKAPSLDKFGPARADLACAIFFRKILLTIFPDLQALINHRIFSVNAFWVIQVPVSSLTCYLSDGIGPMSVGSM